MFILTATFVFLFIMLRLAFVMKYTLRGKYEVTPLMTHYREVIMLGATMSAVFVGALNAVVPYCIPVTVWLAMEAVIVARYFRNPGRVYVT